MVKKKFKSERKFGLKKIWDQQQFCGSKKNFGSNCLFGQMFQDIICLEKCHTDSWYLRVFVVVGGV